MNAFKGKAYKYFISFASVAGKFGNEGQTDYAAANDMLSKIVLKMKAENSDKVFKVINWTAWSGTGMANKESILKVLTEKHIDFLDIKEGVNFFMNEMTSPEAAEVIVAGINESIDKDNIFNTIAKEQDLKGFEKHVLENEFCFIDAIIQKDEKYCESLYRFSLDRDYYLQSHYYGGTPVAPSTFIAEIMIQNSKALVPFLNFIRLNDFNMFYVIKLLKNQDKVIKIISEITDRNENEVTISAKIVSDIFNFKGEIIEQDKLHYNCKIVFSKNKPAPDLGEYSDINWILKTGNWKLETVNVSTFYHPSLLFMGHKMQTINKLLYSYR